MLTAVLAQVIDEEYPHLTRLSAPAAPAAFGSDLDNSFDLDDSSSAANRTYDRSALGTPVTKDGGVPSGAGAKAQRVSVDRGNLADNSDFDDDLFPDLSSKPRTSRFTVGTLYHGAHAMREEKSEHT